eukprot:CAMPEP_0184516732 /NCGR_PEP_ID=MMETSP0198_2-20121128/5187_1 /TAXON_ID=1112570 /ORGANISM="Thraustochytrium sp., Strain LLF1b" /LENGTH=104 /DNA_ID=CAMNT_0026907075 /DNA_START=197 /DNA_END=511 /DNA_ORIENTATION=-
MTVPTLLLREMVGPTCTKVIKHVACIFTNAVLVGLSQVSFTCRLVSQRHYEDSIVHQPLICFRIGTDVWENQRLCARLLLELSASPSYINLDMNWYCETVSAVQ